MKAGAPKGDEVMRCAALFKPSREWKASQPMGCGITHGPHLFRECGAGLEISGCRLGRQCRGQNRYLDDYQRRLKKSAYYPELMQLQKVRSRTRDRRSIGPSNASNTCTAKSFQFSQAIPEGSERDRRGAGGEPPERAYAREDGEPDRNKSCRAQ